jgi:hypothetical protein
MRSYYHLVPPVFCYFSVGYLFDSIDYSRSSWLEWFTDIGMFPHISLADEETFGITCGCGALV